MADDPVSTTRDAKEPDTERLERTPNISDYLRVFSYATKWDFVIYAVASLASVGAGVTLPLMNIIFGQLVGQFTDYFKDSATIPHDDFEQILNRQALYIMALFLGRWGLNSINKFCFRMIGIRLSSSIRLHYLRSLFAQSIHVIDSMPAGAPATAITSTSNTLQLGISERLGTFLEFNATIWGALIVAFIWSWDLTLVTSSLILYILVVMSLVLPLIVKSQSESAQADAQGTAIASEALEGIRLVMACGAQGRVISRYEEWVSKAMKRAQKMAPIVGIQFGLVVCSSHYQPIHANKLMLEQFFGVFGAFGLAFWYGTQRYIAGAISNVGVVIVVLMSVMMILTSLERISTPLIAVSKAMVAACEFFAVIDAPLLPTGSLKPNIASEDIIFEDVTFEYPSRPGVRVLDTLSFRIQPGQNTALIGPSGSGKSTIVGLIERWYSLRAQHVLPKVVEAKPPEKSKDEKNDQIDEEPKIPIEPKLSGSIRIGDHNLEDLDLRWWRAQIGLVQQEPFLFNDTIFGNVANGLIGTEWADVSEAQKRELVQEACQEAYAHEFITRLPDGYETQVGDGGAKLSGGQKQRLAIARSIIKKPQIIILDEPTSAIDARTEKLVQAALDRATRNRTTITIAHRLSTIKKADHIIVLQNGQAVEQGTHHSLVANPSGVYSALVRAQSLRLLLADDAEPSTMETETPALEFDAASDKVLSEDYEVVNLGEDGTHQKQSKGKPRSLVHIFGKLLHKHRAKWPSYLGIIFSAMAVGAGTPIQAWLFAKVIGVFLLAGDELERGGDFWGLMWFVLAVGVGIAYFFEGWVGLRVQYFVSAAYKVQYLTDMLYQKLRFFDEDSNSHGTLSSRIASDAKQLEELFGLNLTLLLSGVFNVTGCIMIALAFGWKLGLVAMFVTMPIMLTSGYWKYRHEVQFDQMNSAVFMESSQFATESIGAIRTVSALTMESTINDRYQQLLDGHVKAALHKARWTSAYFGFADSASLGCQALVFWYGGRLLASGEYTLEAFFVCFMAIIQGAEAASQVLAAAPSAAQATAAANRILDVRESVNIDRAGAMGSKDIPETKGGVRIQLQDVYFKYPTRDVQVFAALSLIIEKGQYAAFVGPSGCGKTTIISLLERFYDLEPNQGAILCNGTNINDLNVYDYRRELSLVSQEPTMFRGTVRDNILFGVADPHSVSDERIHEVCHDAFIHDFIISLPEGYDTDVGQKGISMSGGQKQRIAIARALIRDPKILLLDEATSALDSESEKTVQAAFERARNGRTMIAVAHRLSTIQNADIIFVFDEGKVVEKGTHNELVRKEGVYWGMCQNQALDQ
ncbi:P-loop containing nucleoside triphosphate hydrolase protein [Whalleya microplaca]|nr:P-loop containing nucleoside triphosphate hydrolase protein [Whalleya microplaca]